MKFPNTRSISHVAPIGLLGMTLLAMLFHEIPASNREIVTAIVAGLLGFLSRPTSTPKEPTP